MPYKNIDDRRAYMREYMRRKYATDLQFKTKQNEYKHNWRINNTEKYNEYMKIYMRKYRKDMNAKNSKG